MTEQTSARTDPLWPYTVLAPVVIGAGSMVAYGMYYKLAATNPQALGDISLGQLDLWTSVIAGLARWALATSIILMFKKAGRPILNSLACEGRL